jgi:ATP-binding cassette subfamily C protein
MTGFRDLLSASSRFVRALVGIAGKKAFAATVLVAVGSLLENFGIALLVPILTIVTGGSGDGKLQAMTNQVLHALGAVSAGDRLAVLLAVFTSMTLTSTLVLCTRNIILSDIQAGFIEAERNRIIRRLAAASWTRIATLRHARITHVMSTEIQIVGTGAGFFIHGAVASGTLLAQSVLAFALAPKLAAIAGALVLVGSGFLLLALRRTRAIGAERGLARLTLIGMTASFLGGLKIAIAQNVQAGFVDEFERFQRRTRERQRAFIRGKAYGRFSIAVVPAIAGATVIWIGFQDLGLRPAVLITMILLFVRMTRPLVTLFQAAQQFVLCLPAFEAVRSLDLELDAGDRPRHDAPVQRLPPGPIVFDQIRFVHPGGGGVHAASLVLEPGSMTGLTGPSGSGKTTLVDLLVGILEPQSGRIMIGGQALDSAHLVAWQGAVSYVGQEGFLFHDTVRRNLVWGSAPADDASLWQALETAGARTLVQGLAEGLDTVIGERGTLLSGGARQRLAIARALLRRTRLLVLDEATNAIDVEGEARLLGRLRALEHRPTIVMIAHRPESLRHCDQVATLEHERPLSVRPTAPREFLWRQALAGEASL